MYRIELDEFYIGPSFVCVGPLRGRILLGYTEIINYYLLIKGFLSEGLMESCSKGVHSIELDEFYSGPSFVFAGPLRGRILPGYTEISND